PHCPESSCFSTVSPDWNTSSCNNWNHHMKSDRTRSHRSPAVLNAPDSRLPGFPAAPHNYNLLSHPPPQQDVSPHNYISPEQGSSPQACLRASPRQFLSARNRQHSPDLSNTALLPDSCTLLPKEHIHLL